MNRISGEIAGRDRRKEVVALAALLLLFPNSASVLCVSPGGHVAIEDLNATCCISSTLPAPAGHQSNDGMSPAGDCDNCTDFFMTPNGRGALLASSIYAAPISFSGEHPGNLLSVDLYCRHCWLCGAVDDTDASTLVSASLPLRC